MTAQNNHLEVAKVLLEQGKAPLEAVNIHGNTALHRAAHFGHHSMASVLLKHGANVAAVGQDQYTPLHWAAQENHLEVAKVLLEQGKAPLEAITIEGNTALHLAASKAHHSMASLLLKHGANAVGQEDQYTPLHMAAQENHLEIANANVLLEQGKAPLEAGDHQLTAATTRPSTTPSLPIQPGAGAPAVVVGQAAHVKGATACHSCFYITAVTSVLCWFLVSLLSSFASSIGYGADGELGEESL
jgi:ankyrin repeat protein